MAVATTSEIGAALLRALNLPESTASLTVRFEPNSLITVSCEIHPSAEELARLGRVLETFEE